jgi:MarR family transcriptional regulator for hemolysin
MIYDSKTLKKLPLAEQLDRVARQWKTVISNELAPMELTPSRWTTLWKLQQLGDNISQKVLANALEIKLSSLMRTLEQLEEQGLIIRHCCENDRRARQIVMTDKGHLALNKMASKMKNVRSKLLSGISEEEQLLITDILVRISHNAAIGK